MLRNMSFSYRRRVRTPLFTSSASVSSGTSSVTMLLEAVAADLAPQYPAPARPSIRRRRSANATPSRRPMFMFCSMVPSLWLCRPRAAFVPLQAAARDRRQRLRDGRREIENETDPAVGEDGAPRQRRQAPEHPPERLDDRLPLAVEFIHHEAYTFAILFHHHDVL